MSKYLRTYYRIVNRSYLSVRSRKDETPYEGHHVKPACFGGKRIVLLTAREHFICHFLLYKHFKKFGDTNHKIKMALAFNQMTWRSPDNIERYYNSHSYQIARTAFSQSIKGENHPFYGKKHTDETRKKISNVLRNNEIWKKNSAENMKNVRNNITVEQEELRINNVRKANTERAKLYLIVYPDGKEETFKNIIRYCKENELSRSMVCRHLDSGNPVQRGSEQNKLNTVKMKNTIGCIIKTLKEGEI